MSNITALSGVRLYDNLYDIGEFKKSDIEVNKNALIKYERLKQNDLFYIIRKSYVRQFDCSVCS